MLAFRSEHTRGRQGALSLFGRASVSCKRPLRSHRPDAGTGRASPGIRVRLIAGPGRTLVGAPLRRHTRARWLAPLAAFACQIAGASPPRIRTLLQSGSLSRAGQPGSPSAVMQACAYGQVSRKPRRGPGLPVGYRKNDSMPVGCANPTPAVLSASLVGEGVSQSLRRLRLGHHEEWVEGGIRGAQPRIVAKEVTACVRCRRVIERNRI